MVACWALVMVLKTLAVKLTSLIAIVLDGTAAGIVQWWCSTFCGSLCIDNTQRLSCQEH